MGVYHRDLVLIKSTGDDERRDRTSNEGANTMSDVSAVKRQGLNLALALGATALIMTGCTKAVEVRGNLPDPELVGEIEPGRHSRRDVAQMIGSPSTVSSFQDRKWYYIGQKTSQYAFYKPEVLERSVFVVTFDEQGQVDETLLYTLEDGQVIDPVSRITETQGEDASILQDLLGNLGRFSSDQAPNSAGNRGPGL
jgi:outer membrane protein assembly factor BamE (lipoprotein component of BamABCDE complex)